MHARSRDKAHAGAVLQIAYLSATELLAACMIDGSTKGEMEVGVRGTKTKTKGRASRVTPALATAAAPAQEVGENGEKRHGAAGKMISRMTRGAAREPSTRRLREISARDGAWP